MKFKLLIILYIAIILISCDQKDNLNTSKFTSVCKVEVFELLENFNPSLIDSIKIKDEYIYVNGTDNENIFRLCRYNIDGTNPVIVENINSAGISEYIVSDTDQESACTRQQ